MTSKIMFLAAAALLSGAAAFAAVDTTAMDTDGDGKFSIEEVLTVYSSLSGEEIVAMDINEDGYLDLEELTAADEAGLLPVRAD